MGIATSESQLAPAPSTEEALEVRRNAGIFGLAALAAGAMATAYGWRAVSTGTTVLWALAAVLGVVAVFYAIAWYDARSPLLVADALGVRLREGRDWHGLPWDDVVDVVVHPRRGLLGDGEIEVVARRGTGYAVPIGLATVCSTSDVAAAVRELTRGQTAVTVVEPPTRQTEPTQEVGPELVSAAETEPERAPEPAAEPEPKPEPEPAAGPDPAPEHPATGTDDTGTDDTGTDDTGTDDTGTESGHPAPRHRPVTLVASAGRAIRANVSRSRPASIGTAALKADPAHDSRSDALPEARELRGTRGRVDLVFEPLPMLREEIAVDAAPIEEWPAEAAENPVIGPQLAAVRERSGITVDSLAERTRIRPHVIEAIEVDDFASCGGDFYARGHIRSIARVLGMDVEALVAIYDEKYAHEPVDARRVFEAELATGPRPSIRLAKGGPNWAAMVGVVMVLAIIWGIGQFFTGDREAPAQTPTTVQHEPAGDPAGLADLGAPTSNEIVLRGIGADSKVVVRDHTGAVQWKGHLSDGDRSNLTVPGRATIVAEHGDAVKVRVNDNKKGTVGDGDARAETVRGKH